MSKWRTIQLDLSTARTRHPISCLCGGVIVWATSSPDAAVSIDFDQDDATLETPIRAGQVFEGSIKQVYVTYAAQTGHTLTLALFGDYGDGSQPIRPRGGDADTGHRLLSDYTWQEVNGMIPVVTPETLMLTLTADRIITSFYYYFAGDYALLSYVNQAYVRFYRGAALYHEYSMHSRIQYPNVSIAGDLVGMVVRAGDTIRVGNPNTGNSGYFAIRLRSV